MPKFPFGSFILVFILLCASGVRAQYSPKDLQKQADEAFDQGLYAEAMPAYAQLLSLEPGNAFYSYRYGATALYGDPGKREEAIKYLRFATQNGSEPLAWYFLGKAYHLNYQFADALNAYAKFAEKAAKKEADQWQVAQAMATAENGKSLLNSIKDISVLDKKQAAEKEFFRLYDLSNIGGKILVTPEELLSPLDLKYNHRSLIHFAGVGTRVYFSSYGKSGENGLDIYSADVLPGGTFSEPQALPQNVNTPYDEDYPFMHPDGRTFYFSSKGHSSMGGYDVFKSNVDPASGTFSAPKNMDFAINTPDDDLFYIADSLNQLANFASGRSSKQGNLHVYQVRVESLPVQLTLIKGTFSNRINPGLRTIKVTVKDAATNKEVDVQYSDPNTGAYLLSFPKSGKYKILVEAQNSERVHSGLIEVPASDGLNAYLQELELVAPSGIEKLIINNRFDQTYDGDINALVQEILRKRAELEINFDGTDEVPEAPEPAQDEEANIDLAYNKAGFGAGLSNAQVIQNADDRVALMQSNAEAVAANRDKASKAATEALARANSLLQKANELASVSPETDGGEAAFRAAVAQWEASAAHEEARVAAELSDALNRKHDDLQEMADKERALIEKMKQDAASGDYDTVLQAFKAENERLKSLDKLSLRVDMAAEVSLSGKEARTEAEKALSRAMRLRDETEALQSSRMKKRDELAESKGKAAQELNAEIERLDSEIADMEKATQRAYALAYEKDAAAARIIEQVALLKAIEANNAAPDADAAMVALSALNDVDREIKNVKVVRKAAEAYLLQHPEALADLGTGNVLREFERLTGVGTYSIEEATALTESKGALALSAEKPKSSQVSQDTKQEQDDRLAVATQEAAIAEVESAENSEASQTVIASANVVQQATPEAISSTNAPAEKQLTDAPAVVASQDQTGERIEVISGQIQAANDWISIIEESMNATVEAANDGDADAQEQLKEYERLLTEKREELASLEGDLLALQASEESPAPAIEQRRDARVEALLSEVNALDPALISRYESKFNEASSTKAFVSDLNQLDPEYIARLTKAEMSGLSAPEIAAERIRINTELLQRIDQMEPDPSGARGGIKPKRVEELRRIKALEIQEDRLLMEGRASYSPRTADAVAYAEMLQVDVTDDPRQQEEVAGERSALEGNEAVPSMMSPSLQAALEQPYSWDNFVPGYTDIFAEKYNLNSPEEKITERIAAHKAMIQRMKEDIDLIAVMPEAQRREDPRLVQRYEQLLSERNLIAEALNADSELLETIKTTEPKVSVDAEDSEELEAALAATDPAPIGTRNPQLEAALLQSEKFMAEAPNKLQQNYTSLSASTAPTAEKLRAMADFNKTQAAEVTVEIERLLVIMDSINEDIARDQLQLQIQQLDAMLADNLQEVDRLTAEAEAAEMVTLAASLSENEDTTAKVEEEVTENADPLEDLQIATALPIEVDQLSYKSLYASMNTNALNMASEEAKARRVEADQLAKAYSAADTPDERKELYAQIQQVANKVKRADIELNKAVKNANAMEVDYYLASINAAYAAIDISEPEVEQKATDAMQEVREIQAQIDATIQQRDELDAFDTQAYSELLQQEKLLIDQLEDVAYRFQEIKAAETVQLAVNETEPLSKSNEETELSNETATSAPPVPRADSLSATAETAAELTQPTADRATLTAAGTENAESAQGLETTKSAEIAATNPEVVALLPDETSSQSEPDEAAVQRHEPLAGKQYITPALAQRLDTLTAERIAQLSTEHPDALASAQLAQIEGAEAQRAFLLKSDLLDAAIAEKLPASEGELEYLTMMVVADSLKKMELRQGELMRINYDRALERTAEAERLRGMLPLESSERNRVKMLERAQRIEQEAEVYYADAAYFAEAAENMRSTRKLSEQRIATVAKALEPMQVNVLNNLLNAAPYTVVTTDLVGDALVEAIENEPEESNSTPDPDLTEPEPDELSPAVAPKVVTSGNWLEMVEIIAEKTDFSDIEETMFVVADRAVYTAEKPIPVDPEMPKGLIFQVQVGAFRNPIPQDLFGEIAPLMGQKLDNEITRYRAGLFQQYGAAVEARDVIRGMGYRDAFVVAYVDGEYLSAQQARAIIEQAATLLTNETASADAGTSVQTAPAEDTPSRRESEEAFEAQADPSPELPEARADYYNDPEAAEAVQVEAVSGLFYTVQVGVYSKPVKLDQLFNLDNLNSELTANRLIRYTTGRYASVAAASSAKQRAIEKGVADAFVTAYYNGKRIGLAEAQAILEREGEQVLRIGLQPASGNGAPASEAPGEELVPPSENSDTPAPEVKDSSNAAPTDEADGATYVVVLGQFGSEVPDEFARFLLENSTLGIRQIVGPGGQSLFASPEFESRRAAMDFLNKAKAAGANSAILATSENGQIKALETR